MGKSKDKSSQTIFIEDKLWNEVKGRAGDAGVSLIATKLFKLWLAGEIVLTLEPTPAQKLNREHFSDKYID